MRNAADELPVHVVDTDRLLPGDVIVTRSPKSLMSEFIQAATQSEYSHAMIVTTPPLTVESTARGVTRFKISRMMIKDASSIRVLRLKERSLHAQALERLARRADAAVAREYAFADAVLAIFTGVPKVEKGRYFCSQLVAEMYATEGIQLFEDIEPAKITPGMLPESVKLEDITDRVLRVPSFVEFMFSDGLVDGDADTLYNTEIEIRQRLAKSLVRSLRPYGADITSVDEALAFLMKGYKDEAPWVTEVDGLMNDALRESGLVDYWSGAFPAGIYHLDLDVVDFMRQDPIAFRLIAPGLRDLYNGMLADKYKAVEYWERDVQQLYQVVVYVTGRESVFYTFLRMSEERLWSTFRMRETVRRALEIVEHAIATLPEPT